MGLKDIELDKLIWEGLKAYTGGSLKKRLIKMAVGQVTKFLFAKLPFLAWGPLGFIVTQLATKAVVYIMDQTIIGAHVAYIYGDTHLDKVRMRNVIKKFRELEKEGMTDEQRKKLDDELADAGRELIRFGTIK